VAGPAGPVLVKLGLPPPPAASHRAVPFRCHAPKSDALRVKPERPEKLFTSNLRRLQGQFSVQTLA